MDLKEIVPEYHSKNIFIRSLFLKRLKIALQLAWQKLQSGDELKIIDLGCGEGKFLKLVEENFKNVKTFGIDIEPRVLEIKKFLRAEIKVADIRNSGFPDVFFDVVFCLDALEHFENLEKPVDEIKRILKPDGLLIISLPTENLFYKLGRLAIKGTMSEKEGPCSSSHFYNAKTIERFLCSNGFKVSKKALLPAIPFLSLFHIVSFKKIS